MLTLQLFQGNMNKHDILSTIIGKDKTKYWESTPFLKYIKGANRNRFIFYLISSVYVEIIKIEEIKESKEIMDISEHNHL